MEKTSEMEKDWQIQYPPEEGKPYFYNTVSMESTYVTPPLLRETEIGRDYEIINLRREVKKLSEKVNELEHFSDSPRMDTGIYDYASGNKFIRFKTEFVSPPIILMSCVGSTNHSFMTIDKTARITKAGFTARMITHSGSWDNGIIYWVAIAHKLQEEEEEEEKE